TSAKRSDPSSTRSDRKTVRPSAADVRSTRTQRISTPSKSKPSRIKPVKLQDWEEIVQQTAARFGFTDAQMRTANGILADVRRRADTYRRIREPDFERVRQITDSRERKAAQSDLNAPLIAMQQELIERLGTIPTGAQRAAADAKKNAKR
ncbi:MAG: hypothetical protein V3T70_12100, partial [Phycisphaerae bacterium]